MVAPKPPSYVYELVESDEMPTVDLCRSLGSVCCRSCSTQAASTYSNSPATSPDACHWSVKASWLVAFFLSPFAIITTLRSSESFGHLFAIVALLVNLPLWAIQFRALRFDVVRLLVRTPEFWYFTLNSALWCSLLAVYLNGLRSVVALVFFMMSLIIAFVDADAVFTNRLLVVAVLGVVLNVAVIAMINRRLIDDTVAFPILTSGATALEVEDVIISGLITNTLHLIRNAYRRQWELAEQRRMHCSLLRCIVYRRRAKLQLVDGPVPRTALAASSCPIPGFATDAVRPSCVISDTVVRMVCAPVLTTFQAGNTAFPMDLTGPPWRKRTRVAVVLTACAGIALTAVAFLGPLGSTKHAPHRQAVAIATLLLTSAWCGLFWNLCQPQLLRHIVQSFDFLYLSVQLTLAHVCACEFLGWDEGSLALLC